MGPTAPRQLVEVLTRGPGRDDRLADLRVLPPRPGTTAPWPDWVDPAVLAGYRGLGVAEPWTHQVEAARAVWEGRHTVIATSTGSGKSLACWVPALTALRAHSRTIGRVSAISARPTTLYLAPTKALAADQAVALARVLEAGGIRDIAISPCDGDTPREVRGWIRERADVVLTNPDFLHHALLPGHQRWTRLLRGLRYVVVDESHAYRGVFGAHVGLVLRRLTRLARHYGADPVFVLASATTGSPVRSAARLIGVEQGDVTAVTADGAPAGERTIAIWRPARLERLGSLEQAAGSRDDEEDAERRSASAECAELLADLTSAGARTLAFVRSRFAAESVAEGARGHLAHVDAALARRIASYRAGYLPEERRELERALREGELLGVVSTNALELGIDISGLDAVLIAGWPGTRVSLWQQLGRAGRAGAAGLGVWIAGTNPLDAYLASHPDALYSTPVEETVFDPFNPYVLAGHLCSAASELPLTDADAQYFGPGTEALATSLERGGKLRRRARGWYWTEPTSPAALVSLRGEAAPQVQVVLAETGQVLGTVDAGRADATVHPGAVYIHQGASFVVDVLDRVDGVALVRAETPPYVTRADARTSVRIRDVARREEWGSASFYLGLVEVTSQVVSYQRLRLPGLERTDAVPLDCPEHTMVTAACWWTVPESLLIDARIAKADWSGALHGAEHAAIGLLPLVATCDRWDLGGLSTALHPDTEAPTIFVYDALPGGSGFAERGFAARTTWLAATRDLIAACGCAAGCPACIQSPKCGNANQYLDKAAALTLLKALTTS